MPALDFREIPQAQTAGGLQDTFEFLARDFLEANGLSVEQGPDRGPDDGRDLIVVESRSGVLGDTSKRWLVSCKHKAHSGSVVKDSDEQNIRDRLEQHQADGFIGFYSTTVSSALGRRLNAMSSSYEVKILDHESIETWLLQSPAGQLIAERYFPKSYARWRPENSDPSNFLDQYEPLNCVVCGQDLLSPEMSATYRGNVIWAYEYVDELLLDRKVFDFYWVCKEECDKQMAEYYSNYQTSWQDITDLTIPTRYVQWQMGIMNSIYTGSRRYIPESNGRRIYTPEAFERLKDFTIKLAQLMVKRQTEEQSNRIAALAEIPPYL